MTLSIVLTIALIAYLLMVIIDYSRTTYTIKKLVQDDTLSKKIKEYNTENLCNSYTKLKVLNLK